MRKMRTLLATSVLSIVALSAWSSSSASAERIYECVQSPNNASTQFADQHCLAPTAADGPGFRHVLVTGKKEFVGTNANTAAGTSTAEVARLRGVVSGVETEVQCTTVAASGTMENVEESFAVKALTLEYSGCTVTKPAGKGCVVSGGEVKTKALSETNKGLSAEFAVTPASGTEIMSVKIEGCSVAGLNNTFPVTGSYRLIQTGGTVRSEHTGVTTANTLKFAGQKAGLAETITTKCGWFSTCALTTT